MTLSPGDRIGTYEIVAAIGAGAIGEVYRARDLRLHRDVAIKVLAGDPVDTPRRLARFEREARALAALRHPNIAAVFELARIPRGGEETLAIVMELAEGDDLSSRLAEGPLPLSAALRIGRQVADVLSAAHDAGIVHRDLKPANIRVRDDLHVTVLDFGLAKAVAEQDAVAAAGDGVADTVTVASDVTGEGAVVGTAAYMAPEQALGRVVDRRADIWSFGVLLFEMLAGRRPFAGASRADTLAAVLAQEPPWDALPSGTPAAVRRVLARCLVRDRDARLRDIGDARLDLDEALAAPVLAAGAGGRRFTTGRRVAAVLLAAAAVAGALTAGARWGSRTPVEVTYANLDVAPADALDAGGTSATRVLPAGGARTAMAWSPDGRTIAFIGVHQGVRQVYLRALSDETARPVPGTEDAQQVVFSPDGEEIAFWSTGALWRMRKGGGPRVKVFTDPDVYGFSWGSRALVISNGGILSIDMRDPTPVATALTHPAALVRHAAPVLVPGEAAVLFTEHDRQWTSGDERIMALRLEPGAVPREVLRFAADARFLDDGHIAFVRQGTLFLAAFDVTTLTVRGEPVPVLNGLSHAGLAWDSADLTLHGQFALSAQGTLAYVADARAGEAARELIAVSRTGTITTLDAPARAYRHHVDLSPDGSRLAVSVQSDKGIDLFAYDLAHHTLSRLAESLRGEAVVASWAPDDRLAVQVVDHGAIATAIVRPDVASAVVPVEEAEDFWAGSLAADGRLIGMRGGDLWIYDTTPGAHHAPHQWFATASVEAQPAWSPDGRWVAYSANADGQWNVFARRVDDEHEAVTISPDGGESPAWNPSGGELFYIQRGPEVDRMMSVRLGPGDRFGGAQELFAFPHNSLFPGTRVLTPYTVALDGSAFYGVRERSVPRVPVHALKIAFGWGPAMAARVRPR